MRSKTSAMLLLLSMFALGAVTGVLGDRLYQMQTEAPATQRADRARSHDPVEEMARGLGLDADQKEKLKAIIGESRGRYHALSQEFRPRYESIRMETRDAIREILTDPQKERFEAFIREEDSRSSWRGSRDRKR